MGILLEIWLFVFGVVSEYVLWFVDLFKTGVVVLEGEGFIYGGGLRFVLQWSIASIMMGHVLIILFNNILEIFKRNRNLMPIK